VTFRADRRKSIYPDQRFFSGIETNPDTVEREPYMFMGEQVVLKATDLMSSVSLFPQSEKPQPERLAGMVQHHYYCAGEIISRDDESKDRLFIIVSGEVDVYTRDGDGAGKRVLTLGPRSNSGELTLIQELMETAKLVAKKETHALSLDRWEVEKAMEKHPSLVFDLLQMLIQWIRLIERTLTPINDPLVRLCAHCKDMRLEDGSWVPIELFIEKESKKRVSHGICPECTKKLYPEYFNKE
jgi:CRP-like cAMP-binding protein